LGNYKKYGVLLAVIILIGLLLYWSSGKKTDKKANEKYPQTVKKGDSIIPLVADTFTVKKTINPSGTYLLYQLLKTFENTRSLRGIQTSYEKPLYEKLPLNNSNGSPNLYVSIIGDQYLDYSDKEHLIDFVKEGNYAFIAADVFDQELMEDLVGFIEPTDHFLYDTVIKFNYFHPDYKLPNDITLMNAKLNVYGHPKYTFFNLFDPTTLNADYVKIVEINGIEASPTIMLKLNKGYIILHSIPSNLGNLNLLKEEGKTHAEILFSHFPECNIYWHQNYGEYSEYKNVPKPQKNKKPKQKSRNSPLQFILKQPALLWAFILFVVGIIIYALIFTKRQQRVIPILPSKENSSLQFVDVISKLYFQQKQHNKLVHHIRNSFGLFVRERYYINILLNEDDLIIRLSEKSGIELEKIHAILSKLNNTNVKISEQQLVDLYQELNYFYANCN
jgi:hypothetical protein